MKPVFKYTLSLLFLLGCLSAVAQIMVEDTSTNQPFFKANKFNSTCYVGLDASAAQILSNRVTGYFGANLNWVINHRFVVSAIYDGTAAPLQIQKNLPAGEFADSIHSVHYLGLGFSYILFDTKLFSLQPGFSMGWGRAKYLYSRLNYQTDFMEIVPALEATYNCSKYFRFGLGVNYRAAVAGKFTGMKGSDFSGVGGVIFIKVGTF